MFLKVLFLHAYVSLSLSVFFSKMDFLVQTIISRVPNYLYKKEDIITPHGVSSMF